jgi:hypothetical protein
MREHRSISRWALVGALMLLALPLFASQASAALPLTPVPTFTTQNDENGADDQPGQKDLSLQGVATPAPGDLWTMWQWDDTGLSGGNTGDACSLFDTDNDFKVNFSVCVSIGLNPAVQQSGSPRVWTCNDTKVQTCPQSAQVTPINTACATNTNATDPFHNGQKDTQAICHIALADVGGVNSAKLINTCSYPSQSPTSAPSDCVLIPRDAFITIQKSATPDAGSFPFRLGPTATAATNPVVFTAAGSQTSSTIAIRSGIALSIKEDVPANWAIDSPAPTCSGATGNGTSNGTFTLDTINNLTAASDNVIACVFRDKQQTGAIRIKKTPAGSTTGLSGAVFTIDGITGTFTTDANGFACKDGLPFATYNVNETTAPNGYSVDTASKSVTVSSAGACPSTTPTDVTFTDTVVKGTVNIHKKTDTGGPLADATFTLYNDVAPVGGTRNAGATTDPITSPALSCKTNAAGDCTISNVPLGNYWVVETITPPGYTSADDQPVSIVLGATPGTGDSHSLTFTDSAAAGTINVHKIGFGGVDLAGATFKLYVDNTVIGEFNVLLDQDTGKTCGPTSNAGTCSITGVAPGNYILVETTVPAGYTAAAPVAVTVGLGSGSNQGDVVNVPAISDPVVNGTIVINKTGTGGVSLNGATFTLYTDNAPVGGTFDAGVDTTTGKTCTTASGTCSISNVTPGDYWVVETTTPPGYDTAAAQSVKVGIGATAGVGDTDTLGFLDAVVNGTVSITKTDDSATPNRLANAEFTLYTDVSPFGGSRSAANDTITSPVKKCTTAASGTCDITSVPPGRYWVVETVTPTGYDTAADKAITVGIGSAAHQGDTVPVSFTDPRQHRVVVLVCHEGTDTLYSRDVTVGGVTKQSRSGAGLTDAQQKALCDAGGASFGNISGHPDVNALVELSKVNGAAG